MSNFVIRNHCPACSGESFSQLYSNAFNDGVVKQYLKDFYCLQGGVDFDFLIDANYTLCECKNCSLVFQKEILNDKGMSLLYEKWLDPEKIITLFEQTYPLKYYTRYVSLSFTLARFFKVNPANLRFFDFGMGWGNWLLTAKALGINVYGSELSEDRIKHAKSNGISVVTWDEIPGQNFDYINTDQVFEHLPKPLETLQHLATGLRKGGVLRICVPDGNVNKRVLAIMDWSAPKGTENSLNIVAPLEHINCFTSQSIVKMAELAGLKWISIPRYPRLVVEQAPTSLGEKIRYSLQLPKDIARKLYRILKPIDLSTVEKPTGTNLFFVKA